MSMFCYQCEQTAKGEGCTKFGVCGKDPKVASLQDLLVHAAKGISMYAHRAGKLGVHDHDIDLFVVEALFTTVTNVNFDATRLKGLLRQAAELKEKARTMYHNAALKAGNIEEELSGPAVWQPTADLQGLVTEGLEVGILVRREALGEDITALQELLLYGLKGTAAYVDHAYILGDPDRRRPGGRIRYRRQRPALVARSVLVRRCCRCWSTRSTSSRSQPRKRISRQYSDKESHNETQDYQH